ncbi:ATP--cob(I)alamin adenosyltransferase [Pseudothauera rhizosphaerae]|uniref:ATP--cob(I)alamin adenosyltransferase n=1 Tax=Pseudothauera rhizosphaerae TaxID=2565932 RepID=A0A4S4AK03_9RHOO|nr:ATP--cob(I)alamin adenosyltransferase [Pseudothauera rhizosphaerae]THF58653.1 ATP--cob(I)alamin adenosyltransferase [Pseudothauera rhizosphaerae]
MKPGRNRDELCYPFIYETSCLCDFEVATDELCGHIGAVFSLLPEGMGDIAADLDRLQPLAFHVNGSLRGRLAVEESDIAWLRQRLLHYRAEVRDRIGGFVLPRGQQPVPHLHLARSAAKKAIRLMVRIEQEGREIPMVLPRLCNLMCNFFFVLTLVINRRRGLDETLFASKSYG